MRRTALKRTAPLKRSRIARKPKSREQRTRCSCKLGFLAASGPVGMQIEVCPGYSYTVRGVHQRRCDHCGTVCVSKSGQASAEVEAYRQHRMMIMERDGWTCTEPGCGSRSQLAVHHIVFRAQLPGPEGHDPANLQTLCKRHHDRKHGLK